MAETTPSIIRPPTVVHLWVCPNGHVRLTTYHGYCHCGESSRAFAYGPALLTNKENTP